MNNMYRIGLGYDVHRLESERDLILGGVNIPYEKGLQGHSDADVLTHALMDALLGAMALGDLGTFFPDNRKEFQGISSLELLTQVVFMMKDRNYQLVNLDSVIIAQKPRLRGYVNLMKEALSQSMEVDPGVIGIKATTNEGLDATGAGEAIAAHAVVLLVRCPDS